MNLLPERYEDFPLDVRLGKHPTLTYNLRFDGQSSFGMVDGLEAMKQAVFLALSVPRFQHAIFSWNYGHELEPLLGQANSALLQVRAQEAVREALLQDDRITDVSEFEFSRAGETMTLRFTVETTVGNVESAVRWGDEQEVDRKSTRLNSSHTDSSRMPSSA